MADNIFFDEIVADEGVVKGCEKLTNERITEVINSVIKSETGGRLKAYMNTCVRCGLCSEACHLFLSLDKNPVFSPSGKIKQTLTQMIKKKGKVSPEFIKRAAVTAYTECNLCRRCVIFCPFGIDTAYLLLVVRRICHKLGVTPQYIQDTAHSHSATMNQMWVKDDEWLDTVLWQEEEAKEEIPELRIPLDKEDSDIMYSIIAPEPRFQVELIYEAAILMTVAGVNWTMPASPGWDNSDMAMFSGDEEIMGRIKRVHFETAERLNVNRIVIGECGHALRSVYDTGNRWLGWKMPPVPVIHAIEFYYELLITGRIIIKEKIKVPVTFHDPCNIVRGKGLHGKARYIISQTCECFVEMHPNMEHNFCCGAGGGVINCGPAYKPKRMKGAKVKAEQLKRTGAEIVIAPCHNCHSGIEDIIHHYDLGMEVKFMVDILTMTIDKSYRLEGGRQ